MDDLQRARELAAAGDSHEAREMLVRLLYEDYDNAEIWLELAQVTEDREEYARAVREVLRIDPENVEARRMAVELSREAAQAPRQRAAGTPSQRRGSRTLSFIYNLFVFSLIVAVATGVAIYWVESNQEEATPTAVATPDPALVCVRQVQSVLQRLPARCSLTEAGQVCLGNLEVFFAPQERSLLLPGDRGPLTNYIALETRPFDINTQNFGLLSLRAKTSYADDSPEDALFLMTSGVRLRDYDPRLEVMTFSSNPVVSECASVPPAGLLVSGVKGKAAQFMVNGLVISLDGTVFLQVDVAAGFRVVVLEGTTQLAAGGNDITVSAGQWISWPVDPTLAVRDEPSDRLTTVDTLRGDLGLLIPLGQAAGLAVENWHLPGQGGLPEATAEVEIATSESLETHTPTPLPPDAISPVPLITEEVLPVETETSTSTRTPPRTANPTSVRSTSSPASTASPTKTPSDELK
ncbi:MAG: hypothetical protein DPW16_04645 [Chloroflexi bacterium]|nr:hypothetical protein [Chloroflexota bacterium]